VHALPELVAETLAVAGEGCVVSDVGSVKRVVVRAVEDRRFIGGHPLAGGETAGVEHARADLFQDATWYLTPTSATEGMAYERLHRLITRLGAWPAAMDADTHDVVMATVAHLPHVLANVLVGQAARVLSAERVPATGPSFRDVTRVAGANTPLWRGIYQANADALVDAIDDLVERLQTARGLLAEGDGEAIGAWNDAAREDRRRLLDAGPEGGEVHELVVLVPNRPGIVAEIALALGRATIDIVDMGLYPQSGTHGTVALWIRGDDVTDQAEALVRGLGLEVARA
jgi:prephenate dehydrogenase